jgi:hypothetical protein
MIGLAGMLSIMKQLQVVTTLMSFAPIVLEVGAIVAGLAMVVELIRQIHIFFKTKNDETQFINKFHNDQEIIKAKKALDKGANAFSVFGTSTSSDATSGIGRRDSGAGLAFLSAITGSRPTQHVSVTINDNSQIAIPAGAIEMQKKILTDHNEWIKKKLTKHITSQIQSAVK